MLDTIGGDYGPRSVSTMRPGGTIVTIAVSNVHPELEKVALSRGVRSAVMLVEPDPATLQEITRLYAAGQLRTELEHVLPMSRVQEAHKIAEQGHTRGKVVLTWHAS